MSNNKETNCSKLSFLRECFPFLKEDRIKKICTLMEEGFDINFAIILSFFDISRGKILILRKERRKELSDAIDKLNTNERAEATLFFAISKAGSDENKKNTRFYLKLLDRRQKKEKE